MPLQVEQEEEQGEGVSDGVINEGPSDGQKGPSGGKSPREKPAAQQAPEATPKQGVQAENGAAGEGRVMGTGKRGNITETEGRATGTAVLLSLKLFLSGGHDQGFLQLRVFFSAGLDIILWLLLGKKCRVNQGLEMESRGSGQGMKDKTALPWQAYLVYVDCSVVVCLSTAQLKKHGSSCQWGVNQPAVHHAHARSGA